MSKDIYTSEGSRKDAGRLDDNNLRWKIRRGAELRPIGEIKPLREISNEGQPEFTLEITSIFQARQQLGRTIEKVHWLEDMLGGMLDKNTRDPIRLDYIRDKNLTLSYAAAAKVFIRVWSEFTEPEVLSGLVGNNDPELGEMAGVILDYKKERKAGRKYTEEVIAQVDAFQNVVRDTLMKRKIDANKKIG